MSRKGSNVMDKAKTNHIVAQIVAAVIVLSNKIGIVNTAGWCHWGTPSFHRVNVHNVLLVVCLQTEKKYWYVQITYFPSESYK